MILDPTYATKSLDDLRAEFVRLGTELAALSDQREALLSLMARREALRK